MFGIRMMGNVHTYAKQMQMEIKWQQKKDSGDLAAKLDLSTGAAVEEEQPKSIVETLTVKVPSEEEKEADRKKQEEITNKLRMGGELTKEELEFLKEKNPILYEEYMMAEEARKYEEKAYKEALKQCKTKEEVERLKSTTMGRHLTRVKSIENNPHIPEDKKLLHIGVERRKAEDAQRHSREFVRKGEYDKLPTEAEVREAEKAEAEERRTEMGLDPDGIRIEEKMEDVKAPEAAEKTEQVENGEKAEDPEKEKPEIDIESEAERKVRRAKAKAAYAYAQSDSGTDSDSGSGWSTKA